VSPRTLLLQDDRTIFFQSVHIPASTVSELLVEGFVAMIPAFGNEDQRAAEAIVVELIDLGCAEICCIGPNAEMLHDAIDLIVEDKEALGVVTTWHEDLLEGCEYFLRTAGGRPMCLLALVCDQSNLGLMLQNIALLPSSQTSN